MRLYEARIAPLAAGGYTVRVVHQVLGGKDQPELMLEQRVDVKEGARGRCGFLPARTGLADQRRILSPGALIASPRSASTRSRRKRSGVQGAGCSGIRRGSLPDRPGTPSP
ncbi:MAG: hypothetical protein ACYC3Q_08345, partial [Gemmatimonadaceae bacterium]